MANENTLNETSELYSTATYTGDGTTTNFVVPFPYLYTEDVHVYLDNVAISVYPVISTSNPPSPFEAHWYSSNIIRLTTAPAEGVKIKFQRITNRAEPEVKFRNSSILTEDDLNLIATQLLFVVQEAYDYFSLDYTDIQLAFDTALLAAQGYAGSAGSAATIASSAADVASSAATLVGGYASSISSSLAVAAGYVDNTSAVASGAIASISGARTSALSDISSAQSGVMTVISGGQTSAVNAIGGAQITATSAVSAAQTSAVNAVTTAQGIASSAITSAQTSATSAINSAKSSALDSITSSGAATVSAITSEGGVQLARLEAYGDGFLQQVTGTYTTMTVKLTSPILANTIISLPKDSNNNFMTYVVGTDTLAVGWNGTDCYKNYQYEEVGNDDTISYQIKLLFDANAGDILAFKFLNTNLSALVADPLQPDGVTININSSGKLAAVITSDAVMSAIGYTPANDDVVVRLTGDQNISGTKTFTSSAVFSNGISVINGATISGGMTVSGGISGTCTSATDASSLGGIAASGYVTTSGAQEITGVKTYTGSAVFSSGATFSGGMTADTLTVTSGATISGGMTVDGKGLVYTTTNQQIDGEKTFGGTVTMTQSPRIQRANPYLDFFETDWTKGTAPSATTYQGIRFYDSVGHDAAAIYYHYNTDKVSQIHFRIVEQTTVGATADASLYFQIHSSGRVFYPNTGSNVALGASGNKWKEIWVATNAFSTSDEREKTAIDAIPDAVLDAWADLDWRQFQFRDAVAEKGENARLHTGLVAQRIDEAFKAHGLDITRYGLFGYDEWDAKPEERDENGTVIREAEPAGNGYALRYAEVLTMEAAYQRRRADRAEARISALEQRLGELEAVLASLISPVSEKQEGVSNNG